MAKKQENKFKKLLLTWWFWVIVYFFFGILYQFFVSVINKIFYYMSIFAFLIAVVLICISIINRIQKSSIGHYWKISLTIIGIVLIVVIAFFIIKEAIPHEYNPDNSIKNSLEEDGYEVLDVHSLDFPDSSFNETWVFVKMKSLGDLNEQVWDGLITMYSAYDGMQGWYLAYDFANVDNYVITVLTPTNECYYSIEGDILRSYMQSLRGEKVYYSNGTEGDGRNIKLYLDSQIEAETERCS